MNKPPSLAQRLAEPNHQMNLRELAGNWFHQMIEVRLSNIGFLAADWQLLAAVRGAWGRRLMAGASAEAQRGEPCLWDPPCALDVFFREQVRRGRHAVSKPYVLQMDRAGADLMVRLVIIGFACEWTPLTSHLLVDALAHHIDWSKAGRAPRDLRIEVIETRVRTVDHLPLPHGVNSAEILFVTPFDDESGQFREDPSSLIARLARRVSSLAPWQDTNVVENWHDLAEAWKGLNYDSSELSVSTVKRNTREAHRFHRSGIEGKLVIGGEAFDQIAMLLAFAPAIGIGRGATAGQGRVRVQFF